jgi:hypothetical protein
MSCKMLKLDLFAIAIAYRERMARAAMKYFPDNIYKNRQRRTKFAILPIF